MSTHPEPAWLIVNADDYGYFPGVSRGILKAFRDGIVTATGIFANGEPFREHAAWLAEHPGLDLGVHLNLTERAPVTAAMAARLARWSGSFPRKFAMVKAVMSGAIPKADVRAEWRAQIERCLEAGLAIRFLNSHEHIHMLPGLFQLAGDLAREYHIPHLRLTTTEPGLNLAPGALLRDALVGVMVAVNRPWAAPALRFLGLSGSGRIDPSYLRRLLGRMRPGQIHELMCHPGYQDAAATDLRLLNYHDWEGELNTLTDPTLGELLRRHGVELIGYRHLRVVQGKCVVERGAGA